jgi:hypothetical protein
LRRWAILTLILMLLVASVFIVRQRLTITNAPLNHLTRTPHSAYKYNLCTEAFAFSRAKPDNPYKTDFTFQDPFRKADDTIIPLLWNQDLHNQTVSFNVKVIVGQLDTFTDSISHVSALDGISILLPDQQGHLQRPSIPQVIVSSLERNGTIAILDFTCAVQWKWAAA